MESIFSLEYNKLSELSPPIMIELYNEHVSNLYRNIGVLTSSINKQWGQIFWKIINYTSNNIWESECKDEPEHLLKTVNMYEIIYTSLTFCSIGCMPCSLHIKFYCQINNKIQRNF